MAVVFPVSDSARYVRPSMEIDASSTELELVFVPVCTNLISLNFYHACHLIHFMILITCSTALICSGSCKTPRLHRIIHIIRI